MHSKLCDIQKVPGQSIQEIPWTVKTCAWLLHMSTSLAVPSFIHHGGQGETKIDHILSLQWQEDLRLKVSYMKDYPTTLKHTSDHSPIVALLPNIVTRLPKNTDVKSASASHEWDKIDHRKYCQILHQEFDYRTHKKASFSNFVCMFTNVIQQRLWLQTQHQQNELQKTLMKSTSSNNAFLLVSEIIAEGPEEKVVYCLT